VNEQGKTKTKNYYSNRINNRDRIDSEFIISRNIFGLSNTAVRFSKISDIHFNEELLAVDWWFFSILLQRGFNAVFTNETISYYRQYSANTIGIGNYEPEKIRTGINSKYFHYKTMSALFPLKYGNLFTAIKEIKEHMDQEKDFLDKYCSLVKKNKTINALWWEDIKPLKELL
jgi:hypothetical protein